MITFFWKQAFIDDVKEKLEKNKNDNYCDLIITVCRKKDTSPTRAKSKLRASFTVHIYLELFRRYI